MTSRREFLTAMGASAALATARSAQGAVCNSALPPALTPHTLANDPNPPSLGHYKVLEILQLGGVSHRETTWVERPDNLPMWRELQNVDWSQIVTNSAPQPGANDAYPLAGAVHLGPGCKPLTNLALWDRICAVAVQHHLPPHDPARGYVLGGRTTGRSNYFGFGAAVQRAYGTGGVLPAAYVLDTGNSLISSYAAATGPHLGSSRPVVLPITSTDQQFLQHLDRSNRSGADALLAWYDCDYDDALTFQVSSDRARSSGYQAYAAARDALDRWADLHGLLAAAPDLFVGTPQSAFDTSQNRTRTAIEVAAWLLQQPSVHYVCVLDTGVPKDGTNVDSHAPASLTEHAQIQSLNMWNTCQAVKDQVVSNALDLDETLVLMHSEFGRYHASGPGTEHWIAGYPMLMIGGPIPQRGVRGAIDFNLHAEGMATGGWSGAAHSPVDLRCAVAMAAGLDPFGADMYAVTDTSAPTATPSALRADIERDLLGLI